MTSETRDATESQFANQDFPATRRELIDAHGDDQLTDVSADETVGEVLSRLADSDETTYQTAKEAREALRSAMGSAAVGRRYYTDRAQVGERTTQQVSF